MRRIVVGDKEAKLSERDYKQLLKRFNLENVSETTNTFTKIKEPCICAPYRSPRESGCGNCPFVVFKVNNSGCMDMLSMLELEPLCAALNMFYISWLFKDNDKARLEVTAIRDWLLGLEKVR